MVSEETRIRIIIDTFCDSRSEDTDKRKAEIAKLRQDVNTFENGIKGFNREKNWKTIFMICASVEANTINFFDWDSFIPHNDGYFCGTLFYYFGVECPFSSYLSYTADDISRQCNEKLGIKVNPKKLEEMKSNARLMGISYILT
ncbi:MAG TPA: hypothetical protein EYQ30_00495 [Gammaproteobacteria bacterium]|nr:hypothetical protein [Gammaproteobacteria bacterium]